MLLSRAGMAILFQMRIDPSRPMNGFNRDIKQEPKPIKVGLVLASSRVFHEATVS